MRPIERWWTHSRKFARLSRTQQERAIPQPDVRAARRRVGALPPEIGKTLDGLHAPFRVLRWIAWAPGAPEISREEHRSRRFNAALAAFTASRGWPDDGEMQRLDPHRRATSSVRAKRAEAPRRRAAKDVGPIHDGGELPVTAIDTQALLDFLVSGAAFVPTLGVESSGGVEA